MNDAKFLDSWLVGEATLFAPSVEVTPVDESSVAGLPGARYLEWAQTAATVITRATRDTSAQLARCGTRWEVRVRDDRTGVTGVVFRSDGTWLALSQRRGYWAGVLEGGPDAVGRSLARTVIAARIAAEPQ